MNVNMNMAMTVSLSPENKNARLYCTELYCAVKMSNEIKFTNLI
jgi:hypothetical protein